MSVYVSLWFNPQQVTLTSKYVTGPAKNRAQTTQQVIFVNDTLNPLYASVQIHGSGVYSLSLSKFYQSLQMVNR